MIELLNLAKFDATVQGWFSAVRTAAAEAAVGLAHEAFEEILDHSPQYSGDFVANWRVGTQTTDEFTSGAVSGGSLMPIYGKGDEPAKVYARSHAQWPKLTLGQSLYLYNSARHDEPYAWKIESGDIVFRPINEGSDHPVHLAALMTAFNFNQIGPVQLDGLRKFGV